VYASHNILGFFYFSHRMNLWFQFRHEPEKRPAKSNVHTTTAWAYLTLFGSFLPIGLKALIDCILTRCASLQLLQSSYYLNKIPNSTLSIFQSKDFYSKFKNWNFDIENDRE